MSQKKMRGSAQLSRKTFCWAKNLLNAHPRAHLFIQSSVKFLELHLALTVRVNNGFCAFKVLKIYYQSPAAVMLFKLKKISG